MTEVLEAAGGSLSDGPRAVKVWVREHASVDDVFARVTDAIHEQVFDERMEMLARRAGAPGGEAA